MKPQSFTLKFNPNSKLSAAKPDASLGKPSQTSIASHLNAIFHDDSSNSSTVIVAKDRKKIVEQDEIEDESSGGNSSDLDSDQVRLKS